MESISRWLRPGWRNAIVVYVLFLFALANGGLSFVSLHIPVIRGEYVGLAAMAFALVNWSLAAGPVRTHYAWLLSTAGIYIAGFLVTIMGLKHGFALVFTADTAAPMILSVIFGLLFPVWVLLRCIRGLTRAMAAVPIDNPFSLGV